MEIMTCSLKGFDTKSLQTKVQSIIIRSKKDRNVLIEKIKEFKNNTFPSDSVETFVDEFYYHLAPLEPQLKKMGLWLSKKDLEAIFAESNKPESEEIESKVEDISLDERYFEDISSHFIDSVYGTSTAKDIMLKNFQQNIVKSLFIDLDNNIEIVTNVECNTYLLNYLKKLFNTLKEVFRKELSDIDSLFDDKTSNLPKINKALENKKVLFNIATLLSYSTNKYNRKIFDALNALFILNNFDRLLNHQLPKMVTINHHEGLLHNDTDTPKYIFSFKNTQINTTWRDDDKDIDGTLEISNVIKLLLESINRVNSDGDIIPNSYLSFLEIASVNTLIRSLAHHKNITLDLKQLLIEADNKSINGMKKLFDYLVDPKFNPATYDIYPNQMLTIKALHKGVFADNNSLYAVFIQTLKPKTPYDLDEQPQLYYLLVVQVLNGLEAIDLQQYNRLGGLTENITLKGSLDITLTYAIDNTIGGIFNVEVPVNPIHFKLELTPATDDTDPSLKIVLKDGTTIVRDKGGIITIIDENGFEKKLTAYDVEDAETLFKNNKDFFREVTRFVYDDKFINLLKSRQADYAKLLIMMSSSILYNYAVSKKLYEVAGQDYNSEKEKYFTEEENKRIEPYQHVKLLTYIDKTYTSIKIALAKARDDYKEVTRTNILKDANNKQINSIGLDLIATKPEQLWHRSGWNRSDEVPNSAMATFTLLDTYRGLEFGRDFKGLDKKTATSFSEAENFIATFMFDYLGRIYPNDENDPNKNVVKILPSIISDKSRIPKTLFDLSKEVPEIVASEENPITYLDYDTKDWQELAKKELGNFYDAIYNNFKSLMRVTTQAIAALKTEESEIAKLLTKLNITELDYDSNFKEFNGKIKELSETYNKKEVVKNIIHEIIVKSLLLDPKFELISVLHYTINKDGELHGNAGLYDLLYRWGLIDQNHPAYIAYNLQSGYGTAEEFFAYKLYLYIEDLLKDNCELLLHDSYGKPFLDEVYKKINKDWKTKDNIIFAKIHYNYINEGGLINTALNITSKLDLKNSFIYKKVRRWARLSLYEDAEYLDIDSLKFDLLKFTKAIVEFNNSEKFWKTYSIIKNQIKEIIQGEGSSEAILSITSYIIESIENNIDPKNISITNNILGNIFGTGTNAATITKKLIKFLESDEGKKIKDFIGYYLNNTLNSVFEMNPDLSKYQATEFILSQEYMNSTMGTHLNHPGAGNNLKEYEAAAWGAQVKRNVSMTASKYRFNTDQINGIKSTITAAVIEDDRDIVYNIFGRVDSVKPFDGATIGAGHMNYLENNSLGSNKAGIDKKPFIHDYKAESGSGIIVKTAEFPITNGRLRDSYMLLRLNRKMLDIKFKENIDITKDYKGQNLLGLLNGIASSKYGDMIYQVYENGKQVIYKTIAVRYNEDNKATIYRQKYNSNTESWESSNEFNILVNLDSNYLIWKYVFGGENSGKIKSNGDFEYTELSFMLLAYAMNNVGSVIEKDTIALSLSDIKQPMKNYTIDYIITEGAIKQGAANVNSTQAYFDDNYQLTTMKLSMYDAGIQLDAEHHSDNSTLSLMTLVLNALSARGYSMDESDEVYQALRELTKLALKNFDLGQIGIQRGDTTEMLNFIADIVLRSIKTVGAGDGNLIAALSSEINKAYASGNKITYELIRKNIPISMPAVFNKMVSSLASVLTLRCIRIKFPGSMNVLAPSNKIYKLYGDHLLSYYKGKPINLPNISLKVGEIIQYGDIQMGRTYKLIKVNGVETEVLIDDPREYWKITRQIELGTIIDVEEVLNAGRDLATYGVKFMDDSDITYNMWDLDAIKHLYLTETLYKKLLEELSLATDPVKYEEILNNITDLVNSVGYTGDIFNPKDFKNFLMQELLNTLDALSEGGIVRARGEYVKINNLEIQPYELIASKVYETTFGLRLGDDVQTIINDELFFVRRTLENMSTKADSLSYDVELTMLNGKHIYLLHTDSEISSRLTELKIEFLYEGDDIVLRDLSGKIIRKLSSDKDKIYMDPDGNEIIVTNNLNFYVDNNDFVQIGLTGSANEDATAEVVKSLIYSDKAPVRLMIGNLFLLSDAIKTLRSYEIDELERVFDEIKSDLKNLIEKRSKKELEFILELKTELKKPYPDITRLVKISKTIRNLVNKGKEIHTSFLLSLEFLAARIPAQSHLSFMAMKIVGFDESGKNTAYVSRMQIWLLGSDYDIDKVSLLGYKIKNGHFIKWSPYMNLSSKALLDASKNLPFPKNLMYEIRENLDSKFDILVNTYNSTKEGTVENIIALANLFKHINKLGYVPANDDSLKILLMINTHNSYLQKMNVKDGLINFISSKMYSISKNPKNLILGQSPIDDMTKKIGKLAEKQVMNLKAKGFAPGSPQSKLSMLLLTLKGKENTGIVASAMKNFEACSQYYYKVLQSLDKDALSRLIMDVDIFGKNIRMLANAYVADSGHLNLEVVEALKSVDNNLDAFLLFSAFLSLSTDNAKDPVLSKINAGPNMMGLYTAGFMLGFDAELLVDIMTSPLAWEIANMMNSNVFNDTLGIFNIDGIFDYLKEGPIRTFKSLSKSALIQVKLAIYLYLLKTRPSSLEKVKNAEELPNYLVASTLKNPRFNLMKCLLSAYGENGKEENETDLRNNILDSYKENLTKRIQYNLKLIENPATSNKKRNSLENSVNSDTIKISVIDNMLNNLEDTENPGVYKEIDNYVNNVISLQSNLSEYEMSDLYDYQTHNDVKMRKFMKEILQFRNFARLANRDTITSPYDGLEYKVIDIIKKLSHVANEQSRLRPLLGLNLRLPNDLASQFKFLRNFENIVVQRAAELGSNNKAVKAFKDENNDSLEIDFALFILDKNYRDKIIRLYEPLKAAINIFDVIANSDHYLGYSEAMNANVQSLLMASTSYRIANKVSKDVLSKYFNISRNGKLHENYIKRTLKFITHKINTLFLLSQNVVIDIPALVPIAKPNGEWQKFDTIQQILLGTPHGNATFKRYFEEHLFESLRSQLPANKFLQDIVPFNISNTFNGIGLVNLALTESMMPKSDYERAEFKRYKDSLNSLSGTIHKGYPAVDLFFYYNLIAYNGEATLNSFTTLFEDIFAEKTNDTVRKYVEFFSIFDKEGSFDLDVNFTEDELLLYIAPLENPESGKLKYIRIYNPNTMRVELAKLKEEGEQDFENVDPDFLDLFNLIEDEMSEEFENILTNSFNFSERLASSKYALIEDYLVLPYFVNDYTEMPSIISLSGNILIDLSNKNIIISGNRYTYDQLLIRGKANGHDVKSINEVIVYQFLKDAGVNNSYIDTKYTLSKIEQLLEDYC